MEQKTWGPEIWDEKNRHHDDVGVVMGTGFRRKDLERNTARTMKTAARLLTAGLPAGAAILDAGVGPTARFSIALGKEGFLLSGLDGSKESLRRASAHLDRAGVKAELIEADLANFECAKAFDAVFCAETFFHLPGHLALSAFASFNRALKPGGKALVQFAVLNEMSPLFLLKALIYMSVYKLLRPFFSLVGKRSFYVTVTRHSDQEIRDIALKTGFAVRAEENGYYLFEKTGPPAWGLQPPRQ